MASMLLGCICKNPSLLTNPSYPLTKEDFTPLQFHRIIFVALLNISKTGAQDISEIEIDNYISHYEAQKEILDDNNFMEFIPTIKQLASLDNFELYYTTTRKYSLLRELKENGIDITTYYDETEDEQEAQRKLDKWTVQTILSDVEGKSNKLRNKYDVNYVRNEIKGGQDTQALIEQFKVQPAFGAMLQSPYLSTIWNGWCQGHLLLRGGASGTGKSSCFIGDLCTVGATEMWSDDIEDFIANNNYQSPTLYIHTEMDSRYEIEPKFLACISGVNVSHITKGKLTSTEEQRVLKAGEILKQSNLTICYMPDFTCRTIERKIKELVTNEGIKYVVFDYLESQSALNAEFKATTALASREDMVLKNAASELKQYAEEYSVGIMSAMQLSQGWKETSFIDESFLAGSKAVKNKLDGGSIIVPTSYLKKDMKTLENQFRRAGYGEARMPLPNICETIFKSRFGEYGDKRLKLWSYVNRGTCRRFDYGVWDDANERVSVPITEMDF